MPTPAENLAATLDGREYRSETTKEDRTFAKERGLVIVYGASDDLCEFEGAWTDELGAYGGAEYIFRGGDFVRDTLRHVTAGQPRIEQLWSPEGSDRCWVFKTHNIPDVQRFTIMEDGEPFSDGLVFRLDDCKPTYCEACGQKLVVGP